MLSQVDKLLPPHFFKPFWRAHALLELQQSQQALTMYQQLIKLYSSSSYLKAQLATTMYNLQGTQHGFCVLWFVSLFVVIILFFFFALVVLKRFVVLADFATAEELFDLLLKHDPYRLASMDIYSNILYVSGNAPKLSFLAYQAASTDKYSAETCCIIGSRTSILSC